MQDPRLAPPPAAPEEDDELAALEANAPGARGETVTQRIIDTVLRRKPQGKGVHTQGPKGKEKSGRGRAVRRAMERGAPDYRPDPKTQGHARMGRGKLKKSQAQINWEFREAARVALMKIKLPVILPHCPEVRYIMDGLPKVRNVWALSQLSTEAVHAVAGLGPKRRKALLTYLHSHQVPTKWVA